MNRLSGSTLIRNNYEIKNNNNSASNNNSDWMLKYSQWNDFFS